MRNIRAFVREGQRLIARSPACVVTAPPTNCRSNRSEERRRDRLQQWKNEQRATQLFGVLGEQVGWDEEQATTLREELDRLIRDPLWGL